MARRSSRPSAKMPTIVIDSDSDVSVSSGSDSVFIPMDDAEDDELTSDEALFEVNDLEDEAAEAIDVDTPELATPALQNGSHEIDLEALYGLVDEEDGAWQMKTKWNKKKAARPSVPQREGVPITPSLKAQMKNMMSYERTDFLLKLNHPELVDCWDRLPERENEKGLRADQPPGLSQPLLPFQLEGLSWLIRQERSEWAGGILADEMGMGKTIQMVSLILSNPSERARTTMPGTNGRKQKRGGGGVNGRGATKDVNDDADGDVKGDSAEAANDSLPYSHTTLVLAPTVALLQWRNELTKFASSLKVVVFHGSSRAKSTKVLEECDVVLTSYSVMESSFRREQKGFTRGNMIMKEDSLLHKIRWHRVVLDEAHNIKDRMSNTSKAAFALTARYRWCLSGTPLQNRVGELYSLVRFLECDPFAHYMCRRCDCKSLYWLAAGGHLCPECGHTGAMHTCYWNNNVLRPIQDAGATSARGQVAFGKLTALLRCIMLRRTKTERADDLGLPPRTVRVRRDFFSEAEEEMYESLFKDVKRRFSTFASEGTILNNYSNIFTLITRMRQMSDHPDLVTKSSTAEPVAHDPRDLPLNLVTCQLCFDEAEDAIRSACRHTFCRVCISEYVEACPAPGIPECPVCHINLSIDLEQEALEQRGADDTVNTGRSILNRIDPAQARTSTKIEALLEELSKLRTEKVTLKSIVFSQFTTMLDLVARRLILSGFKIARLQGTMSPEARNKTIEYFMDNTDVTVFLISLKAGGVALNLTEASRVFILDPWWNPAVELQAMDRIHRLGQRRPIVVTRFIIENSIESRILQLQKKKENLAASALGDDSNAMGKLTPNDLRFLFSL